MQSTHLPRTLDLHGKTVLVTAGASGIGRAIAETMAGCGARVHITDVTKSDIDDVTAHVAGVTGSDGDASDAGHVDHVFEEVMARYGGLDVLVNNVGIAGPTGGVDAITDADVARTLDVNLRAHFHFLRRFVPLLRASAADPSIIAISSVAGRLGYPLRTPYAATKWGIVGLVKSLAVELGPQGIRVNAILPGPVDGPRMDSVIENFAAASGISPQSVRSEFLRKASLRRMVKAQDIADLALFLASGLASNISGQAISVDANVEYL